MKNIIKKIVFYFTSILTALKYRKCLNTEKSVLFDLKLVISPENIVQCNHASLKKSSINIQGQNNHVVIDGQLSTTKILMVGENNQIIIRKNAKFINSNIILRGRDCIIEIGCNSTFGSGLYMVCMGNKNKINIGEDCMFADNIELWNTDSHAIKNIKGVTINPSKPVHIGNKVWVGKNSTILKGVNIGNGVVVGINSLVTQDLPPYSICIGSPAKAIQNNIAWERNFITE
ncbi:MAG: acyltransferase [Bacteroidales bacterium]|jgi:acetyltransferase-like isoleucine patch superfamily enzyme|nr:acyltransferase [Bacteroidales bacterium]